MNRLRFTPVLFSPRNSSLQGAHDTSIERLRSIIVWRCVVYTAPWGVLRRLKLTMPQPSKQRPRCFVRLMLQPSFAVDTFFPSENLKGVTVYLVPFRAVYTTPPLGRFSNLDCSTHQEGANTERRVVGKLSARCFQTPSCLAPTLLQLWKYRAKNIGPGGC